MLLCKRQPHLPRVFPAQKLERGGIKALSFAFAELSLSPPTPAPPKLALSHTLVSVLTLWPHSLPPLPSPHCHTAPHPSHFPPPAHLGPPPIPAPGVEHRTQQPCHLCQSLNSERLPVSAGHRPRPWMAHRLLLPPGKRGATARPCSGREGVVRKGRVGGGSPRPGRGAFGWGSPAGLRQGKMSTE